MQAPHPRGLDGLASIPARHAPDHFFARHLAWPLLTFVLAATALAFFDGDRQWADTLYAWQGYAWTLRSSFVADTLVHDGGHLLSLASWGMVLLIWIGSQAHAHLVPWRRPLAYLLLATAAAALLVGWMKSWTDMDCPWDILGYGGTRPYHGLFAPRTGPRGACFPAAHASAGYCWMALYFFFLATRPRLRWFGLGVGLALGLLLGLTQQMRGAHFLSHDLWSLMLCWLTALALYAAMLRGKEAESERGAASQPSHSIR